MTLTKRGPGDIIHRGDFEPLHNNLNFIVDNTKSEKIIMQAATLFVALSCLEIDKESYIVFNRIADDLQDMYNLIKH